MVVGKAKREMIDFKKAHFLLWVCLFLLNTEVHLKTLIKSRDLFRGFFVSPDNFIKYLHGEVVYCKKCKGFKHQISMFGKQAGGQ